MTAFLLHICLECFHGSDVNGMWKLLNGIFQDIDSIRCNDNEMIVKNAGIEMLSTMNGDKNTGMIIWCKVFIANLLLVPK